MRTLQQSQLYLHSVAIGKSMPRMFGICAYKGGVTLHCLTKDFFQETCQHCIARLRGLQT